MAYEIADRQTYVLDAFRLPGLRQPMAIVGLDKTRNSIPRRVKYVM